jgi:diguanylate cyclase (GGDEF)-like protein
MSHDLDETAHWEAPQPAPAGIPRRAWLTVITGTEAGRVYTLSEGTCTIGRGSTADIHLADGRISREHTQIVVLEDGTATVRDCSSRNGTMLGSRALSAIPCALRDGAKLQIGGSVVMRFAFRDYIEEHFERKLYHSATRDGLTGAYNKHHFTNSLEKEFAHAQRYGRPMALVLLDLDDFKAVNDNLGHQAGDHVLFEVATRLSDELRGDELVARYGGEEFVVLLRKADAREALQVAERLRRLLEGAVITWNGERVRVSASFGVASTSTSRAAGPDELFQRADDCLYRAKRMGKNRVCGPPLNGR